MYKESISILLLSIVVTLSLNSCTNDASQNNKSESDTTAVADTPKVVVPQSLEAPEKTNVFQAWAIKDSDSLRQQLDAFDSTQSKIIEVLNRADKRHLKRIDTIIVPASFATLLDYSPFPLQLETIAQVNKLVIFSYPIQAYAVYENGNLILWGPTNMGKQSSKTPTGLFFCNWKGKEVRSSIDNSWILKWNFNVHNTYGVGWHQYSLPGYPASHACMRLLAEDAKWLYDWADQWKLKNGVLVAKGTPVIIYGAYPWGARKPWRSLIENPNANNISLDSMNTVIAPHLEAISNAQQARVSYLETLHKTADTTEI